MVVQFETSELEYLAVTPLKEIRGKQKFPVEVIKGYQARITQLSHIQRLDELRPFRGLNFEFLKGDRKGQCSLRINDQYRLIITPLSEDRIQIILINEISKHYE